jgi:uncharacterized membrane protein YcaP (DUF421 family)
MQQDLRQFDLHRLIVGENPGWFMFEVIVRSLLVYIILMLAMRVMGKRVAGQMSISELAVIVTLGAAVGVPMQVPDRGMLPALLILCVAVAFQRGFAIWGFKDNRVETVVHGAVNVLVQDGRILLDQARATALSGDRLFAMLRLRGIEHLGQVRRVFLETSGDISVYQFPKQRPGLSILPRFDEQLRASLKPVAGLFACANCGAVRQANERPENECEYCENCEWTDAVEDLGREDARHSHDNGSDGEGRRLHWTAAGER